jgi:hypothetical protein
MSELQRVESCTKYELPSFHVFRSYTARVVLRGRLWLSKRGCLIHTPTSSGTRDNLAGSNMSTTPLVTRASIDAISNNEGNPIPMIFLVEADTALHLLEVNSYHCVRTETGDASTQTHLGRSRCIIAGCILQEQTCISGESPIPDYCAPRLQLA